MDQLLQLKTLLSESNPVTVIVAVVLMVVGNFALGKLRKSSQAETAADVSRVVKAAFEAGADGHISLDEAMDVAGAGIDTVKALRTKRAEKNGEKPTP